MSFGVELDPVRVGEVDRGEGRRAHDGDVPVRSRRHHGRRRDRIEVVCGRQLVRVPPGLVEPLDVHDGDAVRGSPADQGEEVLLGAGLPHVGVREGATRRCQVDVAVDEARDDRRPGEIDRELCIRRFTGADALDVAIIHEDPLPEGGMRKRHDPGRAVEGPHGAAMIEESRSPSSTTAASSRSSKTLVLSRWRARPIASPAVRIAAIACPDVVGRPPQDEVIDPTEVPGAGAPDRAIQASQGRVREDGGWLRADGEPAHASLVEPVEEGNRLRAPPDPAARSIVSSEIEA